MTERFDISCQRGGTNGPLPRSGMARGNFGVYTRILPSLPFVAMVRPTMTMAEILRGVGYRQEETRTP